MNRRQFLQAAALAAPVAAIGAPPAAEIIRLYGPTARFEGSAAMDRPKISTQWTGVGSATWTVDVPQADDYEIALCYACGAPGSKLEAACGNSRAPAVTEVTHGFFTDPPGSTNPNLNNYERVAVPGGLRLTAGANEIRLRMTDPKPGEAMRLRSVELTPVSAKATLAEERRRALAARSSTDWMVKSGYGLMFHWTGQSQPRHGPQKSYPDAVDAFPVEAFVEMVQETGAGHVLFTLNHAQPHCPAPIEAWEKYHPGLTTNRDLLGELSRALHKAGIRFLLYINSPTFGMLRRIEPGQSVPGSAERYVTMHTEVLDEIGKRYTDNLDGYWFDSWYQSFERYPDVRQDRIFQACKSGNPARATAFNFWILPVGTDWQEYWAGEMGSPGKPATSRYIEAGAGRGLQHQSLLYLDAPWVHSKPETEMEPPHFGADALTRYVQACMEKQGVVTVNLGIYQGGSIGPAAREIMSQVRRSVRV